MTEKEKADELVKDCKEIMLRDFTCSSCSDERQFDMKILKFSIYFCNQAIVLDKRDKMVWWLGVIKILKDELDRLDSIYF